MTFTQQPSRLTHLRKMIVNKKKIALVGLAIGASFTIQAQTNTQSQFSNNQLLAQFELDNQVTVNADRTIELTSAEDKRLLANYDIKYIKRLAGNTSERSIYDEPVLIVFNDAIDVNSSIKSLSASGIFEYVEPDFIANGDALCRNTPNDASFSPRQWALDNNGGPSSSIGVPAAPALTADADIDMPEAWNITTGSMFITVGFLDTGLKMDHPEFSGRLSNNYGDILGNGTDDDGNGFIDDLSGWDFVNNDNDPTDDNGHGTNVTGIAVSNGDNSVGIAGVDWRCKVLVGKVLDNTNSGSYSNIISGIYYLVDNGADVINASLGGTGFSSSLETAVNYAHDNDVPLIAAMGNENSSTVSYPAGFDNAIAVGATTTNNERAQPFTGGGGGSNFGSHIDICAPGDVIYSTKYDSNTNFNFFQSGTSQATPYVTGVVSLMLGLDNTLTFDEVKDALTAGAVDQIGRASEDTPGFDNFHGHGLLNAYNSLREIQAYDGIDYHFAFGSFTWVDGITYTESNNTATAEVTNFLGCEEVRRLELTIFGSPWIFYNGVDLSTIEGAGKYQWYNAETNEIILGANSATYTPTKEGSYSVVVTQEDIEAKSEPFTVTAASIEENNFGSDFVVYPNPTFGNVMIDLGQAYTNTQVRIFDATGKLISTQSNLNTQLINVQIAGERGNYFIEITNDGKKSMLPIVKQ